MQTKIGVQKRDYNPRERKGVICETVIFTTIIQHELTWFPLSELVNAYYIIAQQQKLCVYPTQKGLLCRKDHFEKATNMIEKSVLYN
jgi:type II secretory pathway component PulM